MTDGRSITIDIPLRDGLPTRGIRVEWSRDDQLWIASLPGLPAPSAHGQTPEAALGELRQSVAGYLDRQDDRG